ncbi:MAG TPA: HAMP domain-containing sensor histidine kinase [Vicinamibacterales bacterium]|jgi:signal transduction histidine kinase|nr:HAMP domain-containing sensor histidine kinase [Vicinamibacterales bacterium]
MTADRSAIARASKFLPAIVFLGITAVLVWEYRVTRAAQQGMASRVAHQNEDTADLIIKAITRDMRGAQTRILANRDWEAPPAAESTLDITEQVATTFARYPYLESFFTWRGGNHGMVFFSRTTRLPKWMPAPSTVVNSPIAMAVDPPIAGRIRQNLLRSVDAQLRYAVFDVDLAGVPYQIVSRIEYADPLREHFESVRGFTVNLEWVRQSYFVDILAEVKPSASGGLTQDVALLDEHDRAVVGLTGNGPPIAERTFPLLFMDSSDTASDLPLDADQPQWKLHVSASRDPMLLSATRRADTTLTATTLAIVLCGISLVLAYSAALSSVKLAEMRSRFVSSVTHELKTPLANIRALAGTLARESTVASDHYKAYPHLLIQEADNLGRLVDNLLAYARITDVTETYLFEPVPAAELVDEALRSFQPRLLEGGLEVQIEASPELPFVRADQRAMVLALRNLIDNAMRHAGDHGHVRISTTREDSTVSIDVRDDGTGISGARLAALRESIASRSFSPADGGGLGLAIVSKIVADHGGKLTVDSELGCGTRCTIGLPAC